MAFRNMLYQLSDRTYRTYRWSLLVVLLGLSMASFSIAQESANADENQEETVEQNSMDETEYVDLKDLDYPLDWEAEQYRWHARYGFRYTDWDDPRDNWIRHDASVGYNRKGGGLYNLEARQYDRFDDEEQIGVELYPAVWGRAYANISYFWSPEPLTIPRNDVQVTLYQPLSKSWKVFPGYRHASFPTGDVDVFSFGVAHYIGNWFLRSKLQYSDEAGDDGVMLDVNARYYINRDHRLEFGGSIGEQTVGYYEDDLVEHRHAEIYRARYDYFFTRNWGLDVELRHRSMDGLPDARMALIGLKYRFGAFEPAEKPDPIF